MAGKDDGIMQKAVPDIIGINERIAESYKTIYYTI
jgi:hypothetical protein